MRYGAQHEAQQERKELSQTVSLLWQKKQGAEVRLLSVYPLESLEP